MALLRSLIHCAREHEAFAGRTDIRIVCVYCLDCIVVFHVPFPIELIVFDPLFSNILEAGFEVALLAVILGEQMQTDRA